MEENSEEDVMKKVPAVVGLLMVGLVVNSSLRAQEKDRAELAKALTEAQVSLDQGLSVSASAGKPISAKFEIEDGKLQLSVYKVKGDTFSEVVVDHKTGKAAKTEAITSGDDLSAAKTQNEAMVKAKQSLHAALAKALKGNPGFRAVSIFPTLKDGHSVRAALNAVASLSAVPLPQ